eukprot:TRINITY_DN7704_c0_g1_i1.p1 TRINITY_DN7704_c0_g1~~TRINITY_DN7704_c0_g1_i1.p1  ORF type:complete len:391 (+),score=75.78 TRINITY_DN7704_c0_g1_i1:87-1259(+)
MTDKQKIAPLVRVLAQLSEKAAAIARFCRNEKDSFESMVELKEADKNVRFLKDFKTIADVLIQEFVKKEILDHFPFHPDSILGEEINSFKNSKNENFPITIGSSSDETYQCLSQILDTNLPFARKLADICHFPISSILTPDIQAKLDSSLKVLENVEYFPSDLGICLDPIDGTNEYVTGKFITESDSGIYLQGLNVVTVLLGVYDKSTGDPIAGIVNQPFYKKKQDSHADPLPPQFQSQFYGRFVWGVAQESFHAYSNIFHVNVPRPSPKPVVVMSPSEGEKLKKVIGEFAQISFPAGAGYKLLCVIDGFSDAYLLSKSTTYKWDTCGPHAILLAMGGWVKEFVGGEGRHSIRYSKKDEGATNWVNKNGLVALSPRASVEVFEKALSRVV